MVRALAIASSLSALLGLSACGPSDPPPLGQIIGGTPVAADSTICSTTPTSDPLPSFFPPALRLPAGAVVTKSSERDRIATVSGSAPGSLDEVRASFKASIDAAALPIQSEDNEGFEAEYNFGTLDLQGLVRVTQERCLPGRTAFALSLQNRR